MRATSFWPEDQRLLWSRLIFGGVALLYPAAGWLHVAFFSNVLDPLWSRFAIGGFALCGLLATFLSSWGRGAGRRYLLDVLLAALLVHALQLVVLNDFAPEYAAQFWVSFLAVTYFLYAPLSYWSYSLGASIGALALAALASDHVPRQRLLYFVAGVASVKLIAWLIYRMRRNLVLENFQNNARFRALVEDSPLGVFLSDAQGEIHYVNRRWEQIFGLANGAGLGRRWLSCMLPHEREAIEKAWDDTIRYQRSGVGEIAIRTTQGELRWIRGVNNAMRGPDGEFVGVMGTVEDLTEMRRTQDRAVASAKMGALGVMASNLAHEIATPLTVIMGRAEELRDDLPPEKRVRSADQILKTARRLEEIVRALGRFSRDSRNDGYEQASLKAIIDDLVELSRGRALNQGIVLQVSEIPVNAIVLGKSVELSQVFLNLLNNAFEAVRDASTKRVALRFEELSERFRITVRDTGSGVPASLLGRLFEPFFSTKGAGHGVGLGLSISREILQRHGGGLTYTYLAGESIFSVELPKSPVSTDSLFRNP